MKIKNIVLVLSVLNTFSHLVANAQNSFEGDDVYKIIKSSSPQLPLPYNNGHYSSGVWSPNEDFYQTLQIWLADTTGFLPIWRDMQLNRRFYPRRATIEEPEVGGSGYFIMDKLPTKNNSNFVSCLSFSWAGDFFSYGFLNINKENKVIDILVTSTGGPGPKKIAVFSNFSIGADSVITVYTVRSIEKAFTPMHSENIQSFYGRRTDCRYKISTEGYFVKIDSVIYKPQKYKLTTLSDPKKSIRDGNEKPLK